MKQMRWPCYTLQLTNGRTDMTQWTAKMVAERFEEAILTLRRLPPVKVPGYFNMWPAVIHTEIEILQQEKRPLKLGPPAPDAIDRLDETLQWVLWVEVEERKLIWLRAGRVPWRPICLRLGVDRTTAWRQHTNALNKIAKNLNKTTL